MNFGTILSALLEVAPTVAQDVDKAIADFRAAPSDTGKAVAVANNVLNFLDTFGPLLTKL